MINNRIKIIIIIIKIFILNIMISLWHNNKMNWKVIKVKFGKSNLQGGRRHIVTTKVAAVVTEWDLIKKDKRFSIGSLKIKIVELLITKIIASVWDRQTTYRGKSAKNRNIFWNSFRCNGFRNHQTALITLITY